MQSLETLTQANELNRRLQTIVTHDAYLRLIVAAARENVAVGKIVSKLATEYLPAVADAR